MSVVLDASMTMAWFFDDERTEAAHAVMMRVVADGAIVPNLWRLEVANVFRNAVRRNRCDASYVERSLSRLSKLPIRVDPDTDDHAWHSTRQLSVVEGLTPYDAAYLDLAIRSNLPLASRDRDLVAAAVRKGVDVLTA